MTETTLTKELLLDASIELLEARKTWLDQLQKTRRMADYTIEAYERDSR